MTLAFHPYANLFPLIEGPEFFDLAEDIRANGLLDPIDLIEADGEFQILDGRNRYRALVWIATEGKPLGGVDGWGAWHGEQLPIERVLDVRDSGLYSIAGEDGALAYVLSKNLRRRHLDESQRAMVAARISNAPEGRPSKTAPIGAVSDARAAGLLNVGERSVERAKTVQRDGLPELAAAVDRGAIAVSAAAELAAQPIERQAEILKNLPRDDAGKLMPDIKKALGPVIKEIRAEKVAAKKERRAEREQELGRQIQALPEKAFGVAIEDFEWDHEPWSRDTGVERHPSMHYSTAEDAHTPEEIVARCAARFACLAEDCILFKWATVPHLAIAIRTLELQGFRYVTSLVWNKERAGAARGPGYWFSGEHEIVLVGVRGKVVPPATAHFRSNFSSAVAGHSEKPDTIHEIVEFHWPSVPKVEFNARRARPGWVSWGFDAPETAASDRQAIADQPGPSAQPPLPVGTIETAVRNAPAATVAAVLPAARPGAVIADPLALPEFLRRIPLKQHEMDLTRRDRAPPQIIDGALQTRLPLTDDEIELQAALAQINLGGAVDSWMLRHLVGAGFVHIGTSSATITDDGRSFLAQLVAPAALDLQP